MGKGKDMMNKNGFSLLEIIIAMLILSITVAGSFALFVTSHKFLADAGRRLYAIERGNAFFEKLQKYVSADSAYSGQVFNVVNVDKEGFGSPLDIVKDPQMEIKYKVDERDDDNGLQRVTIRVYPEAV